MGSIIVVVGHKQIVVVYLPSGPISKFSDLRVDYTVSVLRSLIAIKIYTNKRIVRGGIG